LVKESIKRFNFLVKRQKKTIIKHQMEQEQGQLNYKFQK
jgi:hypothetical protein